MEALIEPLTAPIQVVAGAPDFRIAGACLLIWVFFGAGAWTNIGRNSLQKGKIAAWLLRAGDSGAPLPLPER